MATKEAHAKAKSDQSWIDSLVDAIDVAFFRLDTIDLFNESLPDGAYGQDSPRFLFEQQVEGVHLGDVEVELSRVDKLLPAQHRGRSKKVFDDVANCLRTEANYERMLGLTLGLSLAGLDRETVRRIVHRWNPGPK